MIELKIKQAIAIIKALGLPNEQHNDRSALCLLALLGLPPEKPWSEVFNPLIGITPIMSFVRAFYKKNYAPNSRETFRRYTMHQFVNAGIALYNPDAPTRPVNSPKAVYQIEPNVLELIKYFESDEWDSRLAAYLKVQETLVDRYLKERAQTKIPIRLKEDFVFQVSPGKHSELIKAIIEDFGPRFIPGAELIYAGDTGEKWGYFNSEILNKLGVTVNAHGKMPDVVIYSKEKNWLLLIESVTSHGPINAKRYDELAILFAASSAALVYITAFPNRAVMGKYIGEIAWETEVWIADNPSHLIHFNGDKFLGPTSKT